MLNNKKMRGHHIFFPEGCNQGGGAAILKEFLPSQCQTHGATYGAAIFERLRQDTLSKKGTFIGYLELAEELSKHIQMYMETSQNEPLAKNTNNINIYWKKPAWRSVELRVQ